MDENEYSDPFPPGLLKPGDGQGQGQRCRAWCRAWSRPRPGPRQRARLRLWHLCLLVVVSAIVAALARLLGRTQTTAVVGLLVSVSVSVTGLSLLAMAIRIGWIVEEGINQWARRRGGWVGGCVRELSLLLTLTLWLATLVLVEILVLGLILLAMLAGVRFAQTGRSDGPPGTLSSGPCLVLDRRSAPSRLARPTPLAVG